MSDTFFTRDDSAQRISLRERKKRLVQTTIEETALRLFQQQGYEQTSIQDIAEAVMMSTRTFFRYFASKEEVLFGPIHTSLYESMRVLQQVAPTATPHAALRTTFMHMADLYQQQRASFLIRYQVAAQTPSIASIYLYTMMEKEPEICDVLCSRLDGSMDYHEMRLLVGMYMAVFRIAVEIWLKQKAQGDLVSLLREYLDLCSSLSHNI
ncbi:TetR family transcriptional regulator [Ktedonosporobacter rubrisoli]|uniref:TetR family transcriptional regulator n=1 Tax=Ktedonosporobacter rubrisoli TaxID=2509675 RepID=A0A4P6JNN3_KTERU|nr:TetR family transcriptional regulator [Ktedonosporobacter rubrisoli]QBD76346.1 TetR family transcriptional regulator [Ktedonosporobacter rubrisoli]